jgi:hypothetical protein
MHSSTLFLVMLLLIIASLFLRANNSAYPPPEATAGRVRAAFEAPDKSDHIVTVGMSLALHDLKEKSAVDSRIFD